MIDDAAGRKDPACGGLNSKFTAIRRLKQGSIVKQGIITTYPQHQASTHSIIKTLKYMHIVPFAHFSRVGIALDHKHLFYRPRSGTRITLRQMYINPIAQRPGNL